MSRQPRVCLANMLNHWLIKCKLGKQQPGSCKSQVVTREGSWEAEGDTDFQEPSPSRSIKLNLEELSSEANKSQTHGYILLYWVWVAKVPRPSSSSPREARPCQGHLSGAPSPTHSLARHPGNSAPSPSALLHACVSPADAPLSPVLGGGGWVSRL